MYTAFRLGFVVRVNPQARKKPMQNGALTRALAQESQDQDGFDWDLAAHRLVSRVLPSRLHLTAWQHAWRDFQTYGTGSGSSGQYRPYYYGSQQPLTMEELMAWMWTPQTATAFSLLMVALAVFLCCWVSHKIGETICTTASGFLVAALLLVVLMIFVSQWA